MDPALGRLPHIVAWTPLVSWLVHERRALPTGSRVQLWVTVLVASLCVSLCFDYFDVARWFMGVG